MIHLNRAAANVKSRSRKAFNTKQLETNRRSNHVDDCIHSAYFVEMHLGNGLIVHASLSFGQAREDSRGTVLNGIRQPRVANDLENIGKMAVRMFMRDLHARISCANTRAIYSFKLDCVTGQPEQR